MSLHRTDVAATAAVATAGLVVVANVAGWNWPVIGGDRVSVLALGVLGALMYRLAAPRHEPTDALTTALGVLGVGAIFLVAAGALIGTHVVLFLLLLILGVAWGVLTLRHLYPGSERPAPSRR